MQHDDAARKPAARRLFSPTKQRSDSDIHPSLQDPPPRRFFSNNNNNSARSGTPDSLLSSSSQARWDYIRQHVFVAPGGSRSDTPPLAPPTTASIYSQQPSSSSTPSFPSTAAASIPRPPSRSTTPRPGGSSRLALAATKLGFKQVVDHAREAAVDQNIKFSEDVLRACWAARSVDQLSSGGGRGRAGGGVYGDYYSTGSGSVVTGASGRSLPFTKSTMSSFTTTSTANSGRTTPGPVPLNTKKSDHRHSGSSPYTTSTSNLASSSSALNTTTTTPIPSVKYLHQILWQASGTSSSPLRSVYLPHESLVLSSLLIPFISPFDTVGEARIEEERWLAMDAFEVLVKSWVPATELASAERCTWCTQAVSSLDTPSPLRSRVLSALWGLTEPAENTHIVLTPECIKSIASAVFTLLPLISSQQQQQHPQYHLPQPEEQQQTNTDIKIIKEILNHLCIGVIIDEDACELEYGNDVRWDMKWDLVEVVRRLMVCEAAMACLEVCEREVKLYLINYVIKEYWTPLPTSTPTPIQKSISTNRIKHFCNGVLEVIRTPVHEMRYDTRNKIFTRIIRILEEVVVPEVALLSSGGDEARKGVTRVVLELLCIEDGGYGFVVSGGGGRGNTKWAKEVVEKWFLGGTAMDVGEWKAAFEEMLKHLVINAEWKVVVRALTGIVENLVENVRVEIVKMIFGTLIDRLIQDPPPSSLLTLPSSDRPESKYDSHHSRASSHQSQISLTPTMTTTSPPLSLTTLLHNLSTSTPTIFFKPLFTLSASSSSSSVLIKSPLGVAAALCNVCALAGVVRDWWVRDSEMVAVALMSDIGGGGSAKTKGKQREGITSPTPMGSGGEERLGQICVLVELVNKLRFVRRLRDSTSMQGGGGGGVGVGAVEIVRALGSETAKMNLVKFVVGLEVRLAVLIEAKEKSGQTIPPTYRMLYCILFREMRLLTRSLKPAPWLGTVLRWFEEHFNDQAGEWDDQVQRVVEDVKEVYVLARGSVGSLNKRRTFAMMNNASTTTTGGRGEEFNIPEMLGDTLKLVNSLSKGFVPRAVKLLVSVSAMLGPADWIRVAPIVWGHELLLDSDLVGGGGDGKKGKTVVPLVCFLVMQCAEKNPLEFRAMVEVDMRSSDDLTRLESVQKFSQLISWRFQLMSESHDILTDRTHRPFKLARAPLPFVPTDIGSPNYVHNHNADESDPVWISSTISRTKAGARTRMGKGAGPAAVKDAIPVELRRQLVEIGWADDEGEGDEKEVWIRTPVSMLPVNQVEKLESQRSPEHHHHHHHHSRPNSPALSSPQPGGGNSQLSPLMASPNSGAKIDGANGELLRRNSSSGGPTYAKRRAVFVPSLSLIFRVLAMMVYDSNFAVAAAARDTLLDLMRNDPGLLLRPILDLFCDEQGQEGGRELKDISQAVKILTALLHTRHMLPPPMAYAMFNNLAGFLKYGLRQSDPLSLHSAGARKGEGEEVGDTLDSFALTVPIMARLAKYVGELSIREIRKSKMEHFLMPYGTLWFGHMGVPNGPMFPKGPGSELVAGGRRRPINPFEPVQTAVVEMLNPKLINVVMIRIAQNMMFVDMLRKSSQDVVLVRKTMPRFVVPTLDGSGSEGEEDGRILELNEFVPFRKKKGAQLGGEGKAEGLLRVLSLALARTYVTLVAQVFRCMSRNSNDREEMANFVDGLNRILLAHGDDIGIVGHVLIAFMVASARFRRLFTSGGGYALFMPALAKVYAEFHQRIDIKLAVEYAVYRFYALHREAFLFQSLDAITYVAALPETDATQYAARIYDLFYSLRNGVAPTNIDPAGIHDINQSQEKQALLFHVAEDKPQAFLTALRRGDAQSSGQIFFDVPDSYESSRLKMEDFIKLFLTIIAHDPTILRAQYFMRMFRFLAPHLYNASPQARNVLQEGLVALSSILLKTFSKSKSAEAGNAIRVGEADVTIPNGASGPEAPDKNKNMSSPSIMRLDFLFALTGVGQAGCHIPPPMARQAIEIAKLILKDTPPEMLEPLSTFFADLTKLIVLRGELSKPKYVKPFLQEISPIIRTYITILDLTSLFETITQVSSALPYAQDPRFAQLVVHEVCSAGLEACELITSDTELSNTRFRTALVPLLAESIFLRGADVIGELEKRRPSFHFLTKVVLPLVLTLKTTDQLTLDSGKSDASHRTSIASSWARLLFCAMTACQRSFRASENIPLSRAKSREKKGGDEGQWQAHLPTFATALQIIKVIVIRAEAELSSSPADVWYRLAGFLKSALMDGNASFALRGSGPNELSPLPSPTPSPRASVRVTQYPSFFDSPAQSTVEVTPSTRPRVIDYALWSVLEFLCAYRSPLRLQLRLFTVEKVVSLDQELKHQQRRPSPFASPSTSPMSRRISASIFAKPRRSGMFPSPDSSPRASRSPSMMHDPSIPSIHLTPGGSSQGHGRLTSLEIPPSTSGGELRIPGYQYTSPTITPSTPRQRSGAYIQAEAGQGPRIVHLGPTSPSALIPPTPISPSGGGSMGVNNIRLMAQSTKIKSPALIKTTYRRIRTVQTFMGYDTLLPMPGFNAGLGISGLEMESGEVSFATWTKRSALEAVLKEMELLEEEFEDLLRGEAGVGGKSEGGDSIFNEKPIAGTSFVNDTDRTIL